jgi:hypothetical protein
MVGLGGLEPRTALALISIAIVGRVPGTSGISSISPRVADAVSDLFREVFGIQKTSVRVVIGVTSLPLGVPIGLDVIFEVAE